MTLHINTKDPKTITVVLKKKGEVIVILAEKNEYGSQALLPLINKILKTQNLEFRDLTAIEVETGPGSFTGLKVGAAVTQALGFALNIPVNGQIGKSPELVYT